MTICKYDSCTIRSCFNFAGEKKGLYCKKHKEKDMVDVTAKIRCKNCTKYPSYNYENTTVPLYCNLHKLDNMVNIVTKRCIEPNCNTIPIYNYRNNNKGLYCNKHKLSNMINVKDKTCIEQNCNTRANYNIDGEKKGLYCVIHKKENMVDVKNKKCKHPNCIIRPTFNYSDEINPIFCTTHKKSNMVNVVDNKCTYENCNTIATYNYQNHTIPLYCNKHKLDDMVDIRSRLCLTHLCNTRVHYDKYNGYCLRCYIHLYPNMPVSNNYKTKERATSEFILIKYPDITINLDKSIDIGCSRKRPDIYIDLGYQIIICEIDENQHITYDCSCENKRIMELSQDVMHRSIIFIRFNPDQYRDKNGKMVKSCWNINKKGICVISNDKKKEWQQRLNVLSDTIDYWIKNKTDKTVEIIQLFYDQYYVEDSLKIN